MSSKRPGKRGGKRGRPVNIAVRGGPSAAMIAGIVVVVLFAVAVGFGVFRAQHRDSAAASTVPPNATASGVPIGQPSAPATVDIYLDLQCPVCKAYEQREAATLDSLVASGAAQVVYHPIAILDDASSTRYSSRASAASGCAAADKVFPQFIRLLYENQPPENGSGLPDEQLIGYGQQAGAGTGFEQCVRASTYAGWTARLTDQASRDGITQTPTVKVNGQQIDNTDEALRQAVAAAHH